MVKIVKSKKIVEIFIEIIQEYRASGESKN
mgnify:CR=1 FL=1